jgi:hypothetical protein
MFGRGKTAEKLVAEDRAVTLAERQSLVAERERERTACDADIERLTRAADAAAARLAEVETERARASAAARAARDALIVRGRQGQAIVGRIDAQLEAGSDVRIAEFCSALEDEFQGQRHSADSPALTRYLAALRQAQRDALALKTEAVEDVAAALAEIRSRVPSKWEAAA